MKVCAVSELNVDIDNDPSEVTPLTTYTVPANTPISPANREDDEITSIFIGAEDRNAASFKALLEEISSDRSNNSGILVAESASQKIANRVPTPYFIMEEETATSINAAAQKLSKPCAVEKENSTTLNAVANFQPADTARGWAWWFQWLSSFVS